MLRNVNLVSSIYKIKVFPISNESSSGFIDWELLESDSLLKTIWTIYNREVQRSNKNHQILQEFVIEIKINGDPSLRFTFNISNDYKYNVRGSFVKNIRRYRDVPHINIKTDEDIYMAIK